MKPKLNDLMRSVRESTDENLSRSVGAPSESLIEEIISRRASATRRRRRARAAWTQTSVVAAILCLFVAALLGPSFERRVVESTAMAWLMVSPETMDALTEAE